MCGIVGIYSHQDVAAELLDSLIHLQHRDQDAAGIITCDERFYPQHGLGLVREIFTPEMLHVLRGRMGIAHVRYPTAGGYSKADVQPIWVGSPRGMAIAHNGNLTNYQELAASIKKQHRHLNSSLDSEVFLSLLADHLDAKAYVADDDEVFFNLLCYTIQKIAEEVKGAYSVVGLLIGKGLFAFRDPHGIRPLVMGERELEVDKKDYIFASETTSFYSLGFESVGDLHPGEVAYVSPSGKLFRRVLAQKAFSPCAFEYVYFARPDATLDGVSVYRSRLRMGQNLARHWKKTYPNVLPDIVIPVPFTANTAALSFAHELGVRYSEGLYKNPFIGRTFIMPNKSARKRGVQHKLTPQRTEIENKKVLIVDDSIVRGTTSREIIKVIRDFGATEISFVSTCPPIKHPCFYGIDMPSTNELIAATQTDEQIRQYLGVDYLLYQTQDDLVEAITRRGQHHIQKPCMACMDGKYVCGEIDEEKIAVLSSSRVLEQGGAY